MSSSLCIKIEPLNGAEPMTVFVEMVVLAKKLRMLIGADLNGIYVCAAPECKAEDLFAEWSRRMNAKSALRNAVQKDNCPICHQAAPPFDCR